jgi:hypothetical protein
LGEGRGELVAAVALGEDPLFASGCGLAECARVPFEDSARFRHGGPCERRGDAVERLDQEGRSQEALDDLLGALAGADVRQERFGARNRTWL